MTVVGKIMKEKSTLTLQYHLPYMPAYSIKLILKLILTCSFLQPGLGAQTFHQQGTPFLWLSADTLAAVCAG